MISLCGAFSPIPTHTPRYVLPSVSAHPVPSSCEGSPFPFPKEQILRLALETFRGAAATSLLPLTAITKSVPLSLLQWL